MVTVTDGWEPTSHFPLVAVETLSQLVATTLPLVVADIAPVTVPTLSEPEVETVPAPVIDPSIINLPEVVTEICSTSLFTELEPDVVADAIFTPGASTMSFPEVSAFASTMKELKQT